MITDQLAYYIHCFTHLKRDAKNGGAPHKPVLLLSVIRLFEKGLIADNRICISPELVSVFKSIWSKLVITNHFPIFALPFYHMSSEPFWQLMPNPGCEKWVESKSSMRSFSNLMTAVNCALIDSSLSILLAEQSNRDILKDAILDKYFSDTKFNYIVNNDDLPSERFLYETSETYRKKINDLKNNIDEN